MLQQRISIKSLSICYCYLRFHSFCYMTVMDNSATLLSYFDSVNEDSFNHDGSTITSTANADALPMDFFFDDDLDHLLPYDSNTLLETEEDISQFLSTILPANDYQMECSNKVEMDMQHNDVMCDNILYELNSHSTFQPMINGCELLATSIAQGYTHENQFIPPTPHENTITNIEHHNPHNNFDKVGIPLELQRQLTYGLRLHKQQNSSFLRNPSGLPKASDGVFSVSNRVYKNKARGSSRSSFSKNVPKSPVSDVFFEDLEPLEWTVNSYCALDVSNMVNESLRKEFNLLEIYKKMHKDNNIVPPSPRRRRDSIDLVWKPLSIFKVYTIESPKEIEETNYHENISSHSCFGQINMRIKGAWKRTK